MTRRMTWTHLRCSYRREDPRRGLEARLADPLFTLARQWQFGEFQGDDAATPTEIAVESSHAPVTGLVPAKAAKGATPSRALGPSDLLEPLVESTHGDDDPTALRQAGEAGLQFLRMLPSAKRAKVRSRLQKAYPLRSNGPGHGRNQTVLTALARGSFDGRQLYESLQKGDLSFLDQAGLSQGAAVKLSKTWRAYYEARFVPGAPAALWQQERLEQDFGLTAQGANKTNIRLKAEGYPGGHLDWHAFDVDARRSEGIDRPLPETRKAVMIPTPVRYSGMPADRFWDFEDGKVFFGGLALERTDLAQLVLTEFATVYSNDWFLVPVETETGTLSRVDRITVRDNFGEVIEVKPAALDEPKGRPWRFFELSGDPSVSKGLAPLMYLPRSLDEGEESRPVEKVTLVRDEMANLAWGIERVIEGQAGHPIDRDQDWARVRDGFQTYTGEDPDEEPPEDGAWRYRLLSTAPPHWVPFAPEVIKGYPTHRLIRSRMQEWQLLGDAMKTYAGPQGCFMDPSAPMAVAEEELPRGGLSLTRSWQTARSPDGRLLLWPARRKAPASGDASSGRQVDMIEIPKEAPNAE